MHYNSILLLHDHLHQSVYYKSDTVKPHPWKSGKQWSGLTGTLFIGGLYVG